MKIEFGSGANPTQGYFHVDANPDAPCLEYVFELGGEKQSNFGDCVADEIRAVAILEHMSLYDGQMQRALKEWHRILKPGGLLYVAVPDMTPVFKMYLSTSDMLLRCHLSDIIYGTDSVRSMRHAFCFTPSVLFEVLTQFGFKVEKQGVAEDHHTTWWRDNYGVHDLHIYAEARK